MNELIVSTTLHTPILTLFLWIYVVTVIINLIITVELSKATSKDWVMIFFILGGFFSWIAVGILLIFKK